MEEVPAIVVKGLSESKRRALVLADNGSPKAQAGIGIVWVKTNAGRELLQVPA